MKNLRCMIAVAALAFTLPAHAGINDPPIILYRASGVIDDAPNGWATAVSCTNFSGVTEKLTVVVRGPTSTILTNVAVNVAHFNTVVLATSDTALYSSETNMATGAVNAGTVGIAATSVHFTCTVHLLQAIPPNPLMLPLHLLRVSPIPGSQE